MSLFEYDIVNDTVQHDKPYIDIKDQALVLQTKDIDKKYTYCQLAVKYNPPLECYEHYIMFTKDAINDSSKLIRRRYDKFKVSLKSIWNTTIVTPFNTLNKNTNCKLIKSDISDDYVVYRIEV